MSKEKKMQQVFVYFLKSHIFPPIILNRLEQLLLDSSGFNQRKKIKKVAKYFYEIRDVEALEIFSKRNDEF